MKKKLLPLLLLLTLLLLLNMRPEYSINNQKNHHTNKGYKNPYEHKEFTIKDWPKAIWQQIQTKTKRDPQPRALFDSALVHSGNSKPIATWIGHSTFLIQFSGYNMLTDPHFGERASPVSWAGPSRVTPLPFTLAQIPLIDIILISHNHYDHIDTKSIKNILAKQTLRQPVFYVPLGVGKLLASLGCKRVIEMDWWDQIEYSTNGQEQLNIACVPAQHYSGRSLFDKNKTLWSGWVVKCKTFTYYFSGDSGYNKDFKEIGKRFGPMDLACINIGAYGPEWASKGVHLNPEQAVQVHQDVRSKFSVAAHWGTFILSFEDIDAPPSRLRKELERKEISANSFLVMKHGQSVIVP